MSGMMADRSKPQDVRVQLRYIADDSLSEDENATLSPLARAQYDTDTRLALGKPEIIHDVRGVDHDFDLDRDGFRYVKAPIKFDNWGSKTEVRETFMLEMETLLQRELSDYDDIFVFDFQQQSLSRNSLHKLVHVDRTESSVASLVRANYEIMADYLLAGRVRMVNMWRPIRGTVRDCPVAIADGGRLEVPKDLAEIELEGSSPSEPRTVIGGARQREGYHWYYMSEQTEEDVLLFKSYDSDQDVPSTMCLRINFDLPNYPTDTAPTEYIETRALVFTYPSKPITHNQQLQEADMLRAELRSLKHEVQNNRDLVRAILELRQWESVKTKERLNHLLSDRDHSRAETISLSSQVGFLEEWIMNLYVSSITSPQDSLMQKIQHFVSSSPRLRERLVQDQQAYESLKQARNVYGVDAELMFLRQQLQAQNLENQRMKARIKGQVEDGTNEEIVAAVQKAVNCERSKDEFVIKDLRQENQRLRQALNGQT